MTQAQRIKQCWPCDVTANGVAYDWGLAGPGGGWFRLLREPHHTDADITTAKHQLRASQDVVQLEVRPDTEVTS